MSGVGKLIVFGVFVATKHIEPPGGKFSELPAGGSSDIPTLFYSIFIKYTKNAYRL